MKQVLCNVAGPKLLAREEVDQRGVFKDISGDLSASALGIIPQIGEIRAAGPVGLPRWKILAFKLTSHLDGNLAVTEAGLDGLHMSCTAKT